MDIEALFSKGREAADRGNYDYAIAVFRDVVREAPDHVKGRVALRGCEMARFQEKGGGAKAMIPGFLASLLPFIMIHLTKNPRKRIDWCEQFLVGLPASVYVLKKLALACRNAGFLEAAATTLEFARQRKPNNISVMKILGDLYARKEDYKRAVRCYEELARLKPHDRITMDRLRNLRAAEHLSVTKLEESHSFREQIRDVEKAKELEAQEHIVRSADDVEAMIARCQAKLKESPNDTEALIKLGDMYMRRDQFKFAFAAYSKAHEIRPLYSTRVKIGDLGIYQARKAEEAAAEASRREPKRPDLQEKAKQARQARIEMALKEFEQRFADHPTEIGLAHQLGTLYWEKGTREAFSRAIECFQKSVEDPRMKPQARFMLAQLFALDPNTRDMAISQYEQALQLVVSPVSDIAKNIQYNLAQLHERQGNKLKALEWYKKVLQVDAGFKDVRQKIGQLS